MKFLSKSSQNNSFWIGCASFFGGISQDMLLPILPLYFTNVLHFDKSFIGLIDGVATGSATACKIVAGYLSDKLHQRKSFILLGYFLSWISRPLLVLTTSGAGVLALRSLDGIGKGVKDSPKEALVADSAPQATRGKEFGIVRMLDTFGSVVGPFILMGLLYFFKDSAHKYQYIFLLTALPLGVTLFLMAYAVVEPPVRSAAHQLKLQGALPKNFYLFLAISVFFALGNFSDSFFILRAQQAGFGSLAISFIYALFNFVYAIASVPLGIISDKIGRIKIMLLGWIIFAAIHLGLAVSFAPWQVVVLFIAYGLYYATTFGAARALIADMVPEEHRGKAYGIYNACTGFAALPASYAAGRLWDAYSAAAPFLFGAGMAVCSIFLLALFNFRSAHRR